jgi:hypothetical protein
MNELKELVYGDQPNSTSIVEFFKQSLESINYNVEILHRVAVRPALLREGENPKSGFPLFKPLPDNSLSFFFDLLKHVVDVLVPNINEAKMLYVNQCRELNQVKGKLKSDNHLHENSIITMNQNLERRISMVHVFYLGQDQQYTEDGDDSQST